MSRVAIELAAAAVKPDGVERLAVESKELHTQRRAAATTWQKRTEQGSAKRYVELDPAVTSPDTNHPRPHAVGDWAGKEKMLVGLDDHRAEIAVDGVVEPTAVDAERERLMKQAPKKVGHLAVASAGPHPAPDLAPRWSQAT